MCKNRRLTKASLLLVLPLLAAGCNKSPYDRATGGVVTGTGTGPAGSLIIFYNELSSGGGAFEYPAVAAANESLTFSDTTQPTISNHSINFGWNGVPGTFAGFDLMHTPSLDTYATTPGVNLTSGGYTKVTFYARGSLSPNTVLQIEVADDGVTTTPDACLTLSSAGNSADDVCSANVPDPYAEPPQVLSTSWQQYRIAVPHALLANVKDFFKATFVGTGSGGSVYFDRIEYEP